MSDLISRNRAISILEQLEEHSLTGKMDISNAIYLLNNQPTAYDIDNVVEELEERKILHERLVEYENKNGTVTEKYQHIKAIDVLNDAIEIVKQGYVSDDVCEWKSTQINNEWKPSCEPNSTYNVFGVAWFKRCPYCGKKIKVVE